jgi:uridine nucleosidase
LADISKFYLEYHQSVYSKDLVFLHDPCALVAAVKPELFEWKAGAVVVGQQGPLRGKTLLDGNDPSFTEFGVVRAHGCNIQDLSR